MIQSMTAFARKDLQVEWGTLSWELRTVNHRYLDLHFRLPEEFRAIENEARELLRNRLARGKVECFLRFSPDAQPNQSIELNAPLIRQLVDATQNISRSFDFSSDLLLEDKFNGEKLDPDRKKQKKKKKDKKTRKKDKKKKSANIDPLKILAWPGVIQPHTPDPNEIRQAALSLLDNALTELVETRQREGARLHEAIEQRCEAMVPLVQQARTEMPKVMMLVRDKLKEQLEKFLDQLDENRLEQEIALQAQKLDVDEELDRLATHLDEVGRILRNGGAVGRRLDFLMQELHREANTLGSKSLHIETTRISVEMKVLIEQMREQVQNIE